MIFGFLISLIGLFFLAFNTVIFIKNKTVRKKVSNIFIFYLIALLVTEICCHCIGYLKPNSNFFLSHFYFNFQFIFLSVLYFTLFKSKKVKKAIIFIGLCELCIIGSTYFVKPALFWEFNTVEIISTSTVLIGIALLFIYKNFERVHDYFNFSIGLIMYLMCSIFIFLSGNTELVFMEEPYLDIWVLNSVFYIFFQFMIYKEYRHFCKKEA